MAPQNEQTDTNAKKRSAKDILGSAESGILKARADAFQQKAKAQLEKIATAQKALTALETELQQMADDFDNGL